MAFRRAEAVVFAVAVAAGSSCSTGTKARSAATATLRAAALATAQARSFTATLTAAQVTYQAPDRVQQVEHGQASSSSSSSGGPAGVSGPFPETVTKVFIGDRYYEADTPGGQDPVFSVMQRCAGDQTAADYVLRDLRAIAATAEATASGDRYAYRLTQPSGDLIPGAGAAVVSAGFVRSLTPDGAPGPAITITAVNAAPPVTAPRLATPANQVCS